MIVNIIVFIILLVVLIWLNKKFDAYVMKAAGLTFLPVGLEVVAWLATIGFLTCFMAVVPLILKFILFLLTM